ncbi:hypothetical protein [uncultured Agathobaculum sp.]|uniref:hypothetical protein n=1 Tax=uncultured Agathobaculum sp. TaxID=2048140 RepID=UPI00296FE5BD
MKTFKREKQSCTKLQQNNCAFCPRREKLEQKGNQACTENVFYCAAVCRMEDYLQSEDWRVESEENVTIDVCQIHREAIRPPSRTICAVADTPHLHPANRQNAKPVQSAATAPQQRGKREPIPVPLCISPM